MAQICIYIPGTNDEASALRARLNEKAAALGYTDQRGPGAGKGSLGELLQAIDKGEATVVTGKIIVKAPSFGWRREKIDSGADWRRNLGKPSVSAEHYFHDDRRAVVTIIEEKDGSLSIGDEVIVEERDDDGAWEQVGYDQPGRYLAQW